MSTGQPIAWLDGRWGDPGSLCLPLNDRGLLLADGLFETVLIASGRPRLLADHLQRWQHSAAQLGMAAPPSQAWLDPLIAEAIERSGLAGGMGGLGAMQRLRGALRLNWSRGGGGRGLDLPEPAGGERFWLQLTPWQPSFAPLRAIVSRWERRDAASSLSRCKTFAYGSSVQARREAQLAGADDALLPSSTGGLCCGTAANLLVQWQGTWLTPPLSSGCLPGVMRSRALHLGLAQEAPLDLDQLQHSQGVLLLNSLGCRPVWHLEGQPLAQQLAPATAARFWCRLLQA